MSGVKEAYRVSYGVLCNPANETGARYQAALEIIQAIEQSKDTASLAAQDLSHYIEIIKESTESTLHTVMFDVLFRLSLLKGHKEDFAKGGFPEFCADSFKDARFRLKSSRIVLSLIREAEMTKEMVDIGMVDLLLRYSDSFDRDLIKTMPEMILRTRRFVLLSLQEISTDKSFVDLLIQKKLLESVKQNCFNLNFSEAIQRALQNSEAAQQVFMDEMALHQAGMIILFNLTARFENYGRKKRQPRTEEIKYVYDYDTDDEMFKPDISNIDKLDLKPVVDPTTGEPLPVDENARDCSVGLLNQIQQTGLLNEILEAASQNQLEVCLAGLRVIYRLSSVLHLFTSLPVRVIVVKKLLQIGAMLSGQRRTNAFACLLVLSHHPENCSAFIDANTFDSIFYIGMEESGDVLNQICKALRAMAIHKSTAEEMALRSEVPKLLVKILHEDFNGEVGLHVTKAAADKQESVIDETPAVCLMTLYHLAYNSDDARAMLIDSGVVAVLTKLLKAHPEDVIGLHSLMTLSLLSSIEQSYELPQITPALVEMLLQALEASMDDTEFNNLVFTPREVTFCLKLISAENKYAHVVATGLPLYVKIIQQFVADFGVKQEKRISSRTVENVAVVLQNLASNKHVITKLIELGAVFLDLLGQAEEFIADAEEETLYAFENTGALSLQYLQLAIGDEADLTKAREAVGRDLRKSSRVQWSREFKKSGELDAFVATNRLSMDI